MAGYFILHCKWHTLDNLREYQEGAKISLAEFGAESVVFDVKTEVVEGESDYSATVILKFDDLDTAKSWYNSPGYQAVVGLRLAGADGVGRFAESFNGGRS